MSNIEIIICLLLLFMAVPDVCRKIGRAALVFPAFVIFGILLGPFANLPVATMLQQAGQVGFLLLLFEVGLESTVQGMMKVGASSLLVAVLGIVAPFILGFGVSWLFIKELPVELAAVVPADFSLSYVHMFVGAVLCATSVGITARVFKDLGQLQKPEAQIILGAAVIDDVLGLIILAVISGIIAAASAGQALEVGALLRLIGMAFLFLGGALGLGVWLVPKFMQQMGRFRTGGMMLISALLLAFALSYLANKVGLAAIIGAFAAGLILEEKHFHHFREKLHLEQWLKPLATFFVPIFFVLMGIQVRLETFADLAVLGVAAGLTIAAIIGKQICGLGVLEKGYDRLTVGVGMIPRGEVGLIFASIGKSLNVVNDAMFSAIVIMVIVTTLITPPVLKFTLARANQKL